MKPKKSLGQNFLQDGRILRMIAGAIVAKTGETIIEIGPGHGELTEELRMANGGSRILAIEKDERLVGPLQERFKNDRNVEIVAGDTLKLLPSIVSDTKYSVVGNIPYYITGHLLRVLSGLEPKPKNIVLLVQKEVAERICARAPHMNLLAASVQFWAEPEILMHVGRKNFHPVPKVDSAVVRIVPKEAMPIDPEVFYQFLRVLFKQPRKTVLNNLSGKGHKAETRNVLAKKLKGFNVDPGMRPQDLTIRDIEGLANGFR